MNDSQVLAELAGRGLIRRGPDGGWKIAVRKGGRPRKYDEEKVMDVIKDETVISGPEWYGRLVRSGVNLSNMTFDRIRKRLVELGRIEKQGMKWKKVVTR